MVNDRRTYITKSDLLELYKVIIEEQHYYETSYLNHNSFFFGLISALVGGVSIGVFNSNEWYHFLVISIGLLLICAISQMAITSANSGYKRFLDTVTIRAKIEQSLGLTKPYNKKRTDDSYWISEPLIPERHTRARKHFPSSDDFIERLPNAGYNRAIKNLFRMVQVVSTFAVVVLLCNSIFLFV